MHGVIESLKINVPAPNNMKKAFTAIIFPGSYFCLYSVLFIVTSKFSHFCTITFFLFIPFVIRLFPQVAFRVSFLLVFYSFTMMCLSVLFILLGIHWTFRVSKWIWSHINPRKFSLDISSFWFPDS